MNKQKGFTLIELFIALVMCAIVAIIIVTAAAGISNGKSMQSSYTMGLNGLTETRCINGYMFVLGQNGRATEILDEFGKGAKCPTEDTKQ